MKKNQSGSTLIELVLVMAIASILFGFLTFNLISEQKTVTVDGISDALISDMSTQQNKAMLGTGTTNGNSYGIYFQSDKYILFTGTTYSSTNSANFTVPLTSGYSISNITFPNNTIVFSAITGEVNGFLNGHNTVKIQDLQSFKTKTLTVNRYGVVTGEN